MTVDLLLLIILCTALSAVFYCVGWLFGYRAGHDAGQIAGIDYARRHIERLGEHN